VTELIVALDYDVSRAVDLFLQLTIKPDVLWFKIGSQMLLQKNSLILIDTIVEEGFNLFLDLKLYDVRDTVEITARRAFDLGVRMLTVHATLSMLEAAMRAKPPGDRCKVLAVASLTDAPTLGDAVTDRALRASDGLVCSSASPAGWYRRRSEFDGKILVCPGIRPVGYGGDGHVAPVTPSHARLLGADFVVVGRPITAALNPKAVTRSILAELR
jgi:orotidine-5'-phosphate decarboxylase